MKKSKKEIFNPAFKDLKKVLKQADKKQAAKSVEVEPQRVEGRPQRVEEKTQRVGEKPQFDEGKPQLNEEKPQCDEEKTQLDEENPQWDEDEILFKNAMSDVIPISSGKSDKILPSGKTKKPARLRSNNEDEVIAHLQNLVGGSIEMDITFSDEYVEGSISGVSRNIMRKLKRGKFSVQDHIDLHGYTKKDAEELVRRFLINSQRRGLRCVLIVHGRGLNSPDSIPILKDRLPVWLNRGPAKKIVMAFSSAMPYDGGTGALYVLLRKR